MDHVCISAFHSVVVNQILYLYFIYITVPC